jgi:hypothetical protein
VAGAAAVLVVSVAGVSDFLQATADTENATAASEAIERIVDIGAAPGLVECAAGLYFVETAN